MLEGPQEFNHNVSQLVLSTRHSMPITSREQSQRDDTVTPVQISSPRSASSDREAKIGEQSLLLPPQLGSSSDVVDEPSFIDNTISFLKLGMVTAALGVELAISGMTKNRQADSEELMAEKESGIEIKTRCDIDTTHAVLFTSIVFGPYSEHVSSMDTRNRIDVQLRGVTSSIPIVKFYSGN